MNAKDITLQTATGRKALQTHGEKLVSRVEAFLRTPPGDAIADQAWDSVFELVWNPNRSRNVNKIAVDDLIRAVVVAGADQHPDRRA